MSAVMLTADWFPLGTQLYYRKFEIYPMDWNVHLETFAAASAPYGGPIAVRRDDQKFVKVQGAAQAVISIFSGSGRPIASFNRSKVPIVHMAWTNEEELVCIQEDGKVLIYDMFGNYMHGFSVSQKVQDTKVIDAKVFTSPQDFTGIAVMTSIFKVFVVNNIKEPKTRQMSELPRSSLHPTSWAVVPESSTEVLIAREKVLYRLKQDEYHTSSMLEPDISENYTGILEMVVSLNARHLGLFTDSGYLWLGSTDLRTKYCEVNTDMIPRPKQMTWCGNEAIVLYWERNNNDSTDNSLLIVSKYDQKMSYNYDTPVHLSSEIDGVRIISNTQHELLQKVPEVVQKIFRINSTDPGSFLLEASKQFQKGSHKANEYISLVKNDLQMAVNQCIEAVGYEFDTEVQKMLIRAAQFGKCFVSDMRSDSYVNTCRLLRVLNAVRDPKVGIPLTIIQFNFMKGSRAQGLLKRLITRNLYYLALQIAKYLKLPEKEGTSYILVHWAKYKVIHSQLEEETVAREIADKLGYNSGISYSEIASKASENGKKKLAIKLLDYEYKASEQVKLLLELGENTQALIKAIESGDTDLIYMVILKLREKMALGDFKMTIRNFPVAQALYIKYCKMVEYNTQALNEIYIQEDDFASQAEILISESLDEKKIAMRDSNLTSALEAYKKGRKDLYAGMCEESIKLLRYQRELEEKLPNAKRKFIGRSVHDTCRQLLAANEIKLADKFRNDYKIPDKRFWWLKISDLAKKRDWIELDKFSKFKKSPIGYAPFVDVCLSNENRQEALKYLPKVGEDIKVKYCIKAGCLEEAADIAFQQRDVQGLFYVQSKCGSEGGALSEKIGAMIAQLETRK